MEGICARFEKATAEGEFLKFERIENKLSVRPDMHAFLLLDQIVPLQTNRMGTYSDMIAGASHDEIYLVVDPDELNKVATDEQIRDLHRCGVRCDGDGLCMFA